MAKQSSLQEQVVYRNCFYRRNCGGLSLNVGIRILQLLCDCGLSANLIVSDCRTSQICGFAKDDSKCEVLSPQCRKPNTTNMNWSFHMQ